MNASSGSQRKGPFRLLKLTLNKAWDSSIFSESAEAAFWQTLSLPPLLLGLLGALGYLGEWFGPEIVQAVYDRIISFSDTVFSPDVVNNIIEPTVNQILTIGKGEIVSVGFVISLWAGSSAMSSFVDAITVAHDQYGVRNEVWQRFFALLLYLVSLVLLIIGLPLIAIGPNILVELFPDTWAPVLSAWVNALYYPTIGLLLVLALATLYKLALPRKLPWLRGVPGAILAMAIFLLSSIGLRIWFSWITTTGYTYGALATPIAFLLFTYFIGMAVSGGAYLNAAIQELWPARLTRRQRRKWRKLESENVNAQKAGGKSLRERATVPLRIPRKAGKAPGNGKPPARQGDNDPDTGEEGTDADGDGSGSQPFYSPPPEGRPS